MNNTNKKLLFNLQKHFLIFKQNHVSITTRHIKCILVDMSAYVSVCQCAKGRVGSFYDFVSDLLWMGIPSSSENAMLDGRKCVVHVPSSRMRFLRI